MSLNRIIQVLEEIGLTQIEARIYVYLDDKEAVNEKELFKKFNLNSRTLNKYLCNLENRGLVISEIDAFKNFSAVPFEDVLNVIIEKKVKKSKEIIETKKQIISVWKSIDWDNS